MQTIAIDSLREDIQLVLEETRNAVRGINKNSKLRMHYLKLVMMNNIMRAFMELYNLGEEFSKKQHALLDTLKRVEARKKREWFTSDKISLQIALDAFVETLESAEEEQFLEVMHMVESNKDNCKWIVYHNKN